MISYNWDTLMIEQHTQGAIPCDELDVQRRILQKQVEARFTELLREAEKATERWLARSLENIRETAATPSAAIYEDGAALGEERPPE